MAKVDKKELAKMARKLNKLELTDEPVDTKQEVESLMEDFIQAVEEIDDGGKIDEVDEPIIDYYESLIDDDDKGKGTGKGKGKGKGKKETETPDFDDMDEDELLEFADDNDLELTKKEKKLSEKKLRKVVEDYWEEKQEEEADDKKGKAGKGKGKKETDIDLDEIREEIEDMSAKELREYCEENDIEIDTPIKRKDLDDCVEEVMEAIEEGAKKKDKKGKGKAGKGKGTGKGKADKLPKGLRSGTLPAAIYEKIADGGATLKDAMKVTAKIKKKEVDKVRGLALRTIMRKVSATVPIAAVMKGDEEGTFFEVLDEE